MYYIPCGIGEKSYFFIYCKYKHIYPIPSQ